MAASDGKGMLLLRFVEFGAAVLVLLLGLGLLIGFIVAERRRYLHLILDIAAAAGPIDAVNPTPQSGKIGVLLINLGTPDSADARGVRVYLREFLSDPRVIENQGLYWKAVLNGVILNVRPRRKARDYRKIWNTERTSRRSRPSPARRPRSWRFPTRISWSTGRCATAIPRSPRASRR